MQRRDSVLKTGEGFTRLPRWLRVKNLCAMQEMQETQARSLSREDPLEEGMATHSSVLAWRIPRRAEPGGLWPIGSHRAGHTLSDLACP